MLLHYTILLKVVGVFGNSVEGRAPTVSSSATTFPKSRKLRDSLSYP